MNRYERYRIASKWKMLKIRLFYKLTQRMYTS